MGPTPPTTSALSTAIQAQLAASLSTTVPVLPKAFQRVLAKVLAGVLVIVYKYAAANAQQKFIRFASWEETEYNGVRLRPLVELGRELGVGEPNGAVRAELSVTVTVTNQTGSLKAGWQLLRKDTQVLYQTVADVPLDAATVSVTVKASDDPSGGLGAGTVGNLDAGAELEFATPPPNVDRLATVASTLVVGVEGETEAGYRRRVLRVSQSRPQGGAYADYREWGEAVAGVESVYPYRGNPGFVNVYVEATATDANPDGIPDSTLLQAVADNIELDVDGLATNRPVSDRVLTLAITREAIDLEIVGLVADDVAAVQSAIEEGVDEYLRSREPFIVGLSVLPRDDRITQGAVSGIVHELASAEGATVNSVVVRVGAAVVTAYVLTDGAKAKLGTVTYS